MRIARTEVQHLVTPARACMERPPFANHRTVEEVDAANLRAAAMVGHMCGSRARIQWTPDMDAKLRELRDRRWSIAACSEVVGVDKHIIARRLRELGLPTNLVTHAREARLAAAV